MSIARLERSAKRQKGQFFTPSSVAESIVANLDIKPSDRVLEPSFGEGAFIFALTHRMLQQYGWQETKQWLAHRLYGCEIDKDVYERFLRRWREENEECYLPHLKSLDFFTWMPSGISGASSIDPRYYLTSHLAEFDWIVGNPPFGGSFDPELQDSLDALFGFRNGYKIKKETYAFFIVKSIDLLKPGGQLVFICSDTLLTIPTMKGLRAWLMLNCDIRISSVPGDFVETKQNMLLLHLRRKESTIHRYSEQSVVSLSKENEQGGLVRVFERNLTINDIVVTPNLSWSINSDLARYFTGVTLGQKIIASSGMTVGNNELFLRQIAEGGVEEPYEFFLEQEPITLEKEFKRARLGKLSFAQQNTIKARERAGDKEWVLRWRERPCPVFIPLPHPDYCWYNKATPSPLYALPRWVIFWREEGRYVYTYKNNGNWYLHGVGGKPYFRREGLSWALIAGQLHLRYLPPGYILDSGAPCAFLRTGVPAEELYFILGWGLTSLCNDILKKVINHTRNIQGKDFERLPYPVWVCPAQKQIAIEKVKAWVASLQTSPLSLSGSYRQELDQLYAWTDNAIKTPLLSSDKILSGIAEQRELNFFNDIQSL